MELGAALIQDFVSDRLDDYDRELVRGLADEYPNIAAAIADADQINKRVKRRLCRRSAGRSRGSELGRAPATN